MNRTLSRTAFALTALLVACGDDATPGFQDAGRRDVAERDVPTSDLDASDAGEADAGTEDTTPADGGEDAGGEVGDDAGGDATADAGGEDTTADTGSDAGDPCDQDRDGYRAIGAVCGGDDCNDADPRDNPGAIEVCDRIDNNCNGALNEGIDCEFYAHTANDVYLVDPFRLQAEQVIETPATIYDFDTAPDGTLYALAGNSLYEYDEGRNRWNTVGEMGRNFQPNGLAIDSRSVGYATGGNDLYRINLETGAATYVGSMGREGSHEFESSGDCVIDKNDILYMSSRNADRSLDYLARIDANTGDAELIGPTGHRSIFGITAAWGYLFGMTSSGELLEIDPSTGAATLLHTFTVGGDELRWYGSASSPER